MTTLAGTISQPAATLTEVQDQVARRIHRKFEEYADDINDLKDKMLHALNMYRRASTLCLDVSATKPGNERQPGGERKLRSARDDNVVAGGGARGGGWRDQKGGGRDRDYERERRPDRGRDLGRGSPRRTPSRSRSRSRNRQRRDPKRSPPKRKEPKERTRHRYTKTLCV